MIMLGWMVILAVLFAEGAWFNLMANRERDALRREREERADSGDKV